MSTTPITPELAFNYSQRDLSDVLTQLASQINTFTNGQWNSFLQSDVGAAVVQALAQIEDFNALFSDSNCAENFLSTCQLRESAVRLAKALNYPIALAQPATGTALINFPIQDDEVDIPVNSVWSINGISFVALDPLILPAGQTQLNVSLTQGSPYSVTTSAPGTPWFTITIPTNACEIAVTVNGTTYEQTDSWITVTTPNTYKRYENTTGQTIMFGNGQVATMPNSGDTIVVTAVLTQGASGNILTNGQNVTAISAIYNADDVLLNNSINGTTLTSMLNGQDNESTLSIQTNAPAFYGTQGRAVTASDYRAIVLSIPGVTDCQVTGGENLNSYGYVYITAYGGDDPYGLSSDLITQIQNTLQNLNVLTVTPVVQGPAVIELALTVNVGFEQTSYVDIAAARNAIATSITNYFNGFLIGTDMYNSVLGSLTQAVSGVVYGDFSFTLSSFATSQAGNINIPMPNNPDVTNCTLTDTAGDVIFSGDGSQYVAGNTFSYTDTDLEEDDQVCTLTYAGAASDLLVAYNQVIVLTSLVVNASFVS